MPRIKGQDGAVLKVREHLECALAAMADHGTVSPLLGLRIEQAMRRYGLGSLLGPACEELERMVHDVEEARAEVISAVEMLNKR